jgi:RNA polymerase sigma factor (sigma-70 family)
MNTFAITAQTKLKHAAVLRAVRKCGSIAEFAKAVGIGSSTAFKMVNMRWCLPERPAPHWSQDRIDAVKQSIADLAEESPQALFPDELRASVALKTFIGTIEQTKEVPLAGLLEYAESKREQLLLPCPSKSAETVELHDDVMRALRTISERESLIIQLRWGIGEHHGNQHSLQAVGKILGITQERVRQIESRAIRKLQEYSRAKILRSHLD